MLKLFFDFALGKGHGMTIAEMVEAFLKGMLLLVLLGGFYVLAFVYAAAY